MRLSQIFPLDDGYSCDGLQPGEDGIAIAGVEVVRIALGKTTVRKPVSDKVCGDDDEITRALGVVAEFQKRVVDVAIVLARFLAEVIDDNDTCLLQFLQLIVQCSGRYAHHIAVGS